MRFVKSHPLKRRNGTLPVDQSLFDPPRKPQLLPPRKPRKVPPDSVFKGSYEEICEYMDEEWHRFKQNLLKNPSYNTQLHGIMRPNRTITTVRAVVDIDEESEDEYDEDDLSSFFRLSQKTGFSKKKLCEIFRKWLQVTRHDMNVQQFTLWMTNIGFQEVNGHPAMTQPPPIPPVSA